MEQKYYCPDCGHEFEQGEMNYNYDTAKLDFTCPFCDWEGTEDEVEDDEPEMEDWNGGYNQRQLKKDGLAIMTWPDSQELMELEGFRKNTWLINDEWGLKRFGSCAFVYDIDWYHETTMEG